MLTISCSITGEQIGNDLWDDPEELAYCLKALSDNFSGNKSGLKTIEEVVDYFDKSELNSLRDMLQTTLDRIEEKSE